MKSFRLLALLLVLMVLCSAPRRSLAEPPAISENKTKPSAEHPQLRDQPATSKTAVEPEPGSPPTAPPPRTLFGLSMPQVAALAGVLVLFVFGAILIRWLTMPADEEADPQTAAGPQDVPQ